MTVPSPRCPHINKGGHEWESWCMDCGERWPNYIYSQPSLVSGGAPPTDSTYRGEHDWGDSAATPAPPQDAVSALRQWEIDTEKPASASEANAFIDGFLTGARAASERAPTLRSGCGIKDHPAALHRCEPASQPTEESK